MNATAPDSAATSFSRLRRGLRRSLTGVLAGLGLFMPAALRAQLNITRQPDALVTVTAGQTATLSVGATASPAPTYQWRRYGAPIAGATAATYAIPAAGQFHNDFYDVAITSGGTTAISQSSRLLVTLPSYPGAVTVDPAKSLRLEGPEYSNPVGPTLAQAALPDGRFYLAGPFTSIDSQVRGDLVRFTAAGSVDTSFAPPAFDATPRAIALQPDGKLVVVGPFKTVGGVASAGIVRLNADGSRDATFAVGAGFSSGQLSVVAVAPSGGIYVSGVFVGSYQGSATLGYIARLTSAGALDTSFTPPTFSFGAGGINPSGFAFGPAGEIYVHGGFDGVNGVPRNRIARLLASGQVDPAFNPGGGPNNWVYAITVLRNGQLVLGGDFTAYNGIPVGRIARINANGTLDSTFATGAGFSQQVAFVAELPGNNLFVGGLYNSFKGVPVPAGVRLTANGSLDATFAYAGGGRPDTLELLPGNRLLLSGGFLNDLRPGVRILEANGTAGSGFTKPELRFPATARVLAALPGGKVLVAGNFTRVNGSPVPYVMRLNADLTRDTTFPNGPGPTAAVTGRVVQPDGKVILFTDVGAMRINADGSTDTSYVGVTGGGGSMAVVLADGRIFLPTGQSFWDGQPVTNFLVVLEPNGRRATSHPFLPGPNAGARITGTQRLPGGQLLVRGTFTSWNGVSRANAVRLNANGSVDLSYRADSALDVPSYGSALGQSGWSMQRDGKLILAFDVLGGNPYFRLNPDGTVDRSFVAGLPSLMSSGQYLVQPDDRILGVAQGDRPSIDGNLPPIFFRLAPNGGLDGSFSVRGSRYWYEAMLADNGELISSDGTGYLHRYMALPAPTITTPPAAQSAVAGTTLQLSVTAAGEEPFSYQWFKDGVALPGATAGTLRLDSVQPAAAGAYSVAVSNNGGTVTSQAAVVSVSSRAVAGAAFGTFPGNAGSFALYVRDDGSAVFLAYLRSPQTVLVARNLVVGPDRRFRGKVVSGTLTTTGTDGGEVEGVLASDGSVTATVLGRQLSAPPATTSGTTTALVGFYEAGEPNGSGLSYLVVGANGQAYAVAMGPGMAEAGSLSVDAAGVLAGQTDASAARFTGAVQATGLVALALARPTGPMSFSGADNEKRNDVEKLVNISTRSVIAAAGGSFTAGFVVTGDRAKPVLIRAVGPTLAAFQVPDVLRAARLEVFRNSTPLATGNDWGLAANAGVVAATAQRVGAFALPAGSRDAALLLTLEPGNYSAMVTGQEGATGAALVEVYDATDGAIPRGRRIVNVSTRAAVGGDGGPLTAGFVVAGAVPKRVLVRAAGPALTPFGVEGVLARPQLAVYAGDRVLAQNAGWSATGAATIEAAAAQVGAFPFPAGSTDAALILNLPPGPYSAQVSGPAGATGVALVEVYELP